MTVFPRWLPSAGGNTGRRHLTSVNIPLCTTCAKRQQFVRLSHQSRLSLLRKRSYATESKPSLELSKEATTHSQFSWPTPNPSNPYDIPTPYEIFQMSKDEPYSKRRFYELVKIYHPDRHQYARLDKGKGAEAERLSHTARLERYRMVIAANELLSNPRRRRAYDHHGVGWDGRPEFGPNKPRWADINNRRWSGFDDNVHESPRRNATWEDWEEWQMRTERTHGEQRETFTSNGTFVAIVLMCVGLATVGESVRMHGHNRTMVQQVEERHDVNSKELWKRRRESQEISERDERMRRFLMVRGPVGNEVELRPVGQEREGSQFVPDNEIGR